MDSDVTRLEAFKALASRLHEQGRLSPTAYYNEPESTSFFPDEMTSPEEYEMAEEIMGHDVARKLDYWEQECGEALERDQGHYDEEDYRQVQEEAMERAYERRMGC